MSIDGMEDRIEEARLRAIERESLAEKLLEELSRESEKINNKPQLRKQLAPVPDRHTEEQIEAMALPD